MFKSKRSLVLVVMVLAALLIAPGLLSGVANEDPVEIYYFPGGNPGGAFATVKYNGGKDAAEILGDKADVKIQFSGWDPQVMASQFQEAVAVRPDCISVLGWGALKPLIPDAIEKGVVVTMQNVDLPELRKRYAAQGLGYVGQELYSSGYKLGSAAVRRAGLGEGDRALVWGLFAQPERGDRSRGVKNALEEAGVTVDTMEISMEVDNDPVAGIPVIVGYLQSHPDTKLVVTDHGALTATLQQYFEAAGLGPDEIYGAGFDLSPATVDAIKSGYTDLVLDQQPYLQGFLSVMQCYLSVKYKFSGLYIDTGAGLAHAGNIEALAALAEAGIR